MPDSPEQRARRKIDAMLTASGWTVQTRDQINLCVSLGVAIAELTFKTGEPDYTLFVDARAIGTVEAKPEGDTLTGVEEQSAKYVSGVPFGLPAWKSPLPFSYESTGAESFFTNRLDPDPCSRRVFSFPSPGKPCSPGYSMLPERLDTGATASRISGVGRWHSLAGTNPGHQQP